MSRKSAPCARKLKIIAARCETVAATLQLSGAGWCNRRRSDREIQGAQSGFDCQLVKHRAHKFHASASFFAPDDIDLECAFEMLFPPNLFSFARFLFFT
jgi:hypothetical protein